MRLKPPVLEYVVETCELWLKLRGACTRADIVMDTQEDPRYIEAAFKLLHGQGKAVLVERRFAEWVLNPV